MVGVVHFNWSGKIVPRFIGPFPITKRIGFLAYHLLLSAQFSVIHDMFHASSFYGNALGIPVFILEPGIIEEIKVSSDLTLSKHVPACSFMLFMVNFLFQISSSCVDIFLWLLPFAHLFLKIARTQFL